MLTSTGNHPATTVAGLEDNTLADGLFHALTFLAALIGLTLLWAAVRKGAAPAGRQLVGLMLAGWGAFNLVEGIADHQILTVHHVNQDNVILWDTLFLIFGAVLLVAGLALARSGARTSAPRHLSAAAPCCRAGNTGPEVAASEGGATTSRGQPHRRRDCFLRTSAFRPPTRRRSSLAGAHGERRSRATSHHQFAARLGPHCTGVQRFILLASRGSEWERGSHMSAAPLHRLAWRRR
jgi:uncharacterized membrane protein